jgi:hypothetical protein
MRYRLWLHIEQYPEGKCCRHCNDKDGCCVHCELNEDPKDISNEVFPDALPVGFFPTKEDAESWARYHETDTDPKDCEAECMGECGKAKCIHPTCEGDCGTTMPNECPRCKASGDYLQHFPESIYCGKCHRDIWEG